MSDDVADAASNVNALLDENWKAAIPFALAWPLAELSGDPEDVLEAAVSSTMPIITAVLIVAVYLLSTRMGARVSASLLVGIVGSASKALKKPGARLERERTLGSEAEGRHVFTSLRNRDRWK
jgi:hypothetical protein